MSRRSKLAVAQPDELVEARAALSRFTKNGCTSLREHRGPHRQDFVDPIAVAALTLRGQITEDPRSSSHVGAWLSRMKERGAGSCTPLQGSAEGLHVLVLDSQAVAELWDAMAGHRASVASYAQLQADLAQLRKLRGANAGTGEAG